VKHLLSTQDLNRDQAVALLDIAAGMADVNNREIKKLPTLRGKSIVNLFFEDSTRTRISFEIAEKRLSADVVNFSAKGSSVSKGESLKDTAQTLAAMGADAIVVRHHASGAAQALAHAGWIDVPIINAGDGTHQHPTQALLDAFTIRRNFLGNEEMGKDLSGLRVAIVGDIRHSRVARSNLDLLKTLGASTAVVAPATLIGRHPADVAQFFDFDEAITDFKPNVVMMLRIQLERMASSYFPSEREYARLFGLDAERAGRLADDAIIMHPGPMNRGLEISAAAADSAASRILDQVENGVSIRMAVLYQLLSSGEETTID
jgi:aspartate carbamoyltransferase catalytic subunit